MIVGGHLGGPPRARMHTFSPALACPISLSLMITLLALAVGHAAVPTAYIPRTAKMLGINIICDGLTIYTTFLLLNFCINNISELRVFAYVIIDMCRSGMFILVSWLFGNRVSAQRSRSS
jgi:hypothetical protein